MSLRVGGLDEGGERRGKDAHAEAAAGIRPAPAAMQQGSSQTVSCLGIQGPSAAVCHPWHLEHPGAAATATHTVFPAV